MTASLRRTVIVTVAALGVAFVLVWAATTGPTGVVGERHTTPVEVAPAPDDAAPDGDESQSTSQRDRSKESNGAVAWLRDALIFALLLAGLVVAGMATRALLRRIQRDLPESQLVIPLDPLPDLGAGRRALDRDRGGQREALAGDDVRNGIVACWVLLEQAAAEARVGRRPAETVTEFVVRFLHALDIDPRPVAELARLFHEARFSSHAMPPDSRSRAVDSLAGIHHELDRSGAPR